MPIRLAALARDVVHFTFNVVGRGSGGRRLRFKQGEEWVTPNLQALRNAMGVLSLGVVGIGTFTLTSNGNVRVRCDASKPYVKDVPAPRAKVLWAPTPELLEKAARS